MPRRTIQSPGVEIREIDLTTRSGGPVGTSIFVAGFANQGPVDEIFDIGTFSNFETIYGKPTNSAERYFYHTVRQAFNSDGNVFVSRIPYEDTTEKEKYSALFYPVTVGADGNYDFDLGILGSEIDDPTIDDSKITIKNIRDLLPDAGNITVKLEIDDIKLDTFEKVDERTNTQLPADITRISAIIGDDDDNYLSNGVMNGDPRADDGAEHNVVINGNTKRIWYKKDGDNDDESWVDLGRIRVNGEIKGFKIGTGDPDPGESDTEDGFIYINKTAVDSKVSIFYRSGNKGAVETVVGEVVISDLVDVGTNDVSFTVDNIVGSAIQESFTNLMKGISNSEWNGTTNRVVHISQESHFDRAEHHQGRAIIETKENSSSTARTYENANQYVIGNPVFREISKEEYNKISENCIEWSTSPGGEVFNYDKNEGIVTINAGMVIVNKGQTTTNNNFEGYYVGLIDNTQANPNTDYDAVTAQYSVKSDTDTDVTFDSSYEVPTTRLDYVLTSSNREESRSISRTLTEIPTFDIQDDEYHDTISIGLFKVRTSPFNNSDINLSYFLAEGYTGSFDQDRKVQNEQGGGNRSFFLEEQANQSPNIKILVNDNIQNQFKLEPNPNDLTGVQVPDKTVKVESNGIYSLGLYSSPKNTKYISNLPTKLDRIFELASNVDQFNIDVSLEAGLGTIWANAKANKQSDDTTKQDYVFDETKFLNLGNPSTSSANGLFTPNPRPITRIAASNLPDPVDVLDNYKTIYNRFERFARQGRKDHIFVADILRNIVVQGERKVLNDKSKTFSQHIYWAIRHQFRFANSNYVSAYANWAKVYDGNSDRQVWVPFSGIIGAIYANTDSNFAPWYAPAGFSRGVVRGINDIAMTQSQYQRDQLYKIGINPVTHFPNEGIIVFGQKTLQRRPSAFDRVNVRRLFLNLEKRTRVILKYFLFEPNTFLTRTRVVNTLNPIFQHAKQTEGLYDFLIVCDARNNTSEVIQNNEMVIDIYLKPVRAAEFILVNFYAVNNDVNFEELIQ